MTWPSPLFPVFPGLSLSLLQLLSLGSTSPGEPLAFHALQEDSVLAPLGLWGRKAEAAGCREVRTGRFPLGWLPGMRAGPCSGESRFLSLDAEPEQAGRESDARVSWLSQELMVPPFQLWK